MKNLILSAFLTGAAFFSIAATGNEASFSPQDRKFEKSFSVSPGGTFTIATDVGSIRVIGTSSNEVSIVADMHGRESELNEFEITAEKTSEGVQVRGESQRRLTGNWNLEIDYTIRVPREYNLQMGTAGGNLVIDNVKGLIQGSTSGGNLDIKNTDGEINLKTSGGNISAQKTSGPLTMRTSGGNVKLMNLAGNLDVTTSGGNIRIEDIDGRVHAETSGGSIEVRVNGQNKGIDVETSGGDIDIYIPKNVSANLDATTSGGEVECELPVTVSGKVKDNKIRGTLNGGGEMIKAHTSGGSVRIMARN